MKSKKRGGLLSLQHNDAGKVGQGKRGESGFKNRALINMVLLMAIT